MEYNMSGIKQSSLYHFYEATIMSLLMSKIFFFLIFPIVIKRRFNSPAKICDARRY